MIIRTFYEPGYGWRAMVYRTDQSIAYATDSFSSENDARKEAELWASLQPPDPALLDSLRAVLPADVELVAGLGNQIVVQAKEEEDCWPPDMGEPVG